MTVELTTLHDLQQTVCHLPDINRFSLQIWNKAMLLQATVNSLTFLLSNTARHSYLGEWAWYMKTKLKPGDQDWVHLTSFLVQLVQNYFF